MSSTPNKTLGDAEARFSPVILPESPASVSKQKNLTGLPRVAKDMVADLYNNIQKWNQNHVVGANLAKSIAQMKSNNIDDCSNDLDKLASDLYGIVQKLSGITGAFEFLSNQMKSLIKLHKKQTALFISLHNDQLVELVDAIAEAYKAEFKVKKFVLENIAHSRNKNEIMFYAACWTHQQNINSEINLKLEMLLTETGHRKIT